MDCDYEVHTNRTQVGRATRIPAEDYGFSANSITSSLGSGILFIDKDHYIKNFDDGKARPAVVIRRRRAREEGVLVFGNEYSSVEEIEKMSANNFYEQLFSELRAYGLVRDRSFELSPDTFAFVIDRQNPNFSGIN